MCSVKEHTILEDIKRVVCLSDLHTDHIDNMKWLRNHVKDLSSDDLVIVAGDISHDYETFFESLELLLSQGSHVFFICGNHEAWLKRDETISSIEKVDYLHQVCRDTPRCHVDPLYVQGDHPLWVLPLHAWYDGSLTFNQELCQDFNKWPWVDFQRCDWPGFPPADRESDNPKIPIGLAEFFLQRNEQWISYAIEWCQPNEAIMTVSHFLPNVQSLPDWKDLEVTDFQMRDWLDHGAAGVSAKFAKVAGTSLLEDQIRRIQQLASPCKQLHILGHSHRPKDFNHNGIRFIHNPLGKPRERQLFMISPDVSWQPLWDLRQGEILGETIIRLWEEQGGGKEALIKRLEEVGRGRYYKKSS